MQDCFLTVESCIREGLERLEVCGGNEILSSGYKKRQSLQAKSILRYDFTSQPEKTPNPNITKMDPNYLSRLHRSVCFCSLQSLDVCKKSPPELFLDRQLHKTLSNFIIFLLSFQVNGPGRC